MLHYKTIEPATLELLKKLMLDERLKQFVLVGGTALALQLGHRISIDLDLFTIEDFNSQELIPELLKNYNLKPLLQFQQSLICEIDNIKVDFIRFKYKFIRPILEIDGIRMLHVEDIAPMKLDAIAGRGKKKDFYDLYFLLKQFNLTTLFELFLEKYPHQTTFHVAKSLSYFADAENDHDPVVIDKKVTWKKVKKRINLEIRKL